MSAEKDPVCGMNVAPENAVAKSEHEGHTYYFCSVGCKRTFDQQPDKFLQASTHDQRKH